MVCLCAAPRQSLSKKICVSLTSAKFYSTSYSLSPHSGINRHTHTHARTHTRAHTHTLIKGRRFYSLLISWYALRVINLNHVLPLLVVRRSHKCITAEWIPPQTAHSYTPKVMCDSPIVSHCSALFSLEQQHTLEEVHMQDSWASPGSQDCDFLNQSAGPLSRCCFYWFNCTEEPLRVISLLYLIQACCCKVDTCRPEDAQHVSADDRSENWTRFILGFKNLSETSRLRLRAWRILDSWGRFKRQI